VFLTNIWTNKEAGIYIYPVVADHNKPETLIE